METRDLFISQQNRMIFLTSWSPEYVNSMIDATATFKYLTARLTMSRKNIRSDLDLLTVFFGDY